MWASYRPGQRDLCQTPPEPTGPGGSGREIGTGHGLDAVRGNDGTFGDLGRGVTAQDQPASRTSRAARGRGSPNGRDGPIGFAAWLTARTTSRTTRATKAS